MLPPVDQHEGRSPNHERRARPDRWHAGDGDELKHPLESTERFTQSEGPLEETVRAGRRSRSSAAASPVARPLRVQQLRWASSTLASVLTLGCTSTSNDDHCSWREGDETCDDRYHGARPFCGGDCVDSRGQDGCVESRPADNACYYPCGHDMNAAQCSGVANESTGDGMGSDEDEPSTGAATDESTATSDEPATSDAASGESTTGGPECMENSECTDSAVGPFCFDEACVPCSGTLDGNASCTSLGGTRNLCIDNVCVECTAERPEACLVARHVCDIASSTCVPCTAHEQCGTGDEAACHIEAGTCFSTDPDSVLDVDTTENAVTEFTSIEDALLEVSEGEQAVVVLHGTTNFDEACTLSGNRVVAFKLSDEVLGELLWVQTQSNENGGPTLSVSDGATAYLIGLHLRGNLDNSAAVVAANGATVHIEDGDISDNTGLALSADNARVVVDRTFITNNDGGGITATGGSTLTLRNVFVNGAVDIDAITITDSTAILLYVTAAGQLTNFDNQSRALFCQGTTNVTVRNSLFVAANGNPEFDCLGATVTTSAAEGVIAGTGNVELGPLAETWFQEFNTGNLHLDEPAPGVFTAAQWQDGDPLTDIDGDTRPNTPGPDVAGADVPLSP